MAMLIIFATGMISTQNPLNETNTDHCDRFGGEAVSLEVNYPHKQEFAAAGYAPFVVDGEEYGEVRQYGNFSFLRIYEVSMFMT